MDVSSFRSVNSMLTDAFLCQECVLFDSLHRLSVAGFTFSQLKSRPLRDSWALVRNLSRAQSLIPIAMLPFQKPSLSDFPIRSPLPPHENENDHLVFTLQTAL